MFRFLYHARRMSSHSMSVAKLLESQPSSERLTVKGWLKSIRKYKKVIFIHLDDGSTLDRLQVVVSSSLCPKGLKFHSCLSIEGKLEKSQGNRQLIEFVANKIQGAPIDYPFTEKMAYLNEDLRMIPHFRARVTNFASMLRVRSQVKSSMVDYFDKEEFINIDTPLLTTNDCEGNGNSFAVKGQGIVHSYDTNTDIGDAVFGHPVYLTVSGQLHLEAMASGLSKVYSCNPAFRAEGDSRMHLHEFWMVESEESYPDETPHSNYVLLLNRIEDFVKFTLVNILERCHKDIEFQWKFYKRKEVLEENIRKAINKPFLKMSYLDAMKILDENRKEIKHPVKSGQSLNRESELFLSKYCDGVPLFVTDWPIETKPFYMLTNDTTNTAYGVDLIVPDVGEILGGGLREHRLKELSSKIEDKNLSESMSWYIDLRKWGYYPTGGFGLGLERFLQYLLGIDNIKDTIPFPRWNGHCVG